MYGATIDTLSELQQFLEVNDGARAAPAENDLHMPAVLSPTLLTQAQQEHDQLDAWTPPDGMKTYEITGWGDNTISGYELYEQPKAVLGIRTGEYESEYRPEFVEDGDGTVPVQSALATPASNDVIRYWLNLRGSGYAHGNVLESPDLRNLIKGLVESSDDLPADILTDQPVIADRSKHLLFYLHGTGDLWLCNSNGECEGHWEGADYDDVPSSFHGSVGDVSYVSVPSGNQYTLGIHGTSDDTDSLDIEERTGDALTASTTLADIPLTATSVATLTISDSIAAASVLGIDSNGDGVPDFTAKTIPGDISFALPTVSTSTSDGTNTGTSTDPGTGTGTDGTGQTSSRSNNHSTANQTSGGTATSTQAAATSVPVGISTTTMVSAYATTTVALPIQASASATEAIDEENKATLSSSSASTTLPESNLIAAVPEHSLMRLLHALWMLIVRIAHAIKRML
jgi:hypothetical protein